MKDKLKELEEQIFAEQDGVNFSKLIKKLLREYKKNPQEVMEILMTYIKEGQLLHWRNLLVMEMVNQLLTEGEEEYVPFFEWCTHQPNLAYWGTEGLIKTWGTNAYPRLVEVALQKDFTTEVRGQAIKQLALHSGQPFDRGLGSDPGFWKEEELRLDEITAWREQGFPQGSGYIQPAVHPSLKNPETELEKAAARLNQILEKYRKKIKEDPANPSNRLVVAKEEQIQEIEKYWTLPENYKIFLKNYSPLQVSIVSKGFPDGINFYGAEELLQRQIGYSYDAKHDCDFPDWPRGYLVIADSDSDPFCIDTRNIQNGDAPIYFAVHGTGTWEFDLYAESFLAFLKSF